MIVEIDRASPDDLEAGATGTKHIEASVLILLGFGQGRNRHNIDHGSKRSVSRSDYLVKQQSRCLITSSIACRN